MAQDLLNPWVEATEERVAALASATPAWLAPHRRSALEKFAGAGFPTRRDEEWRYSNVTSIVEGPFRSAVTDTADVELGRYTVPAFSGPRVVFVDGQFREDLSQLSGLPEGLTVEPMAAAIARNAPGLEGCFASNPEGTHPFRDLNTAWFGDGIFLHAAAGVTFDAPIHVLCLGGVGGVGASHLRHRFAVEKGAKVSVIEEYRGETETLTNVVTDVFVATGGHLDRIKIAQEAPTAHHVSFLSVLQEGESTFEDLFFAVGGAFTRNEIAAHLDGEEVECTINGLYHLDDERRVDNHTLLRHAKPNCRSWEMYRGVLDGRSRGIFTGKIHVYEDAQKTDAKQNSNTLLLSRDAEADTRPRLEIHADDVRCTHGATVGELDDSALFYLRSRGIPERQARHMLVGAFAAEVLDGLQNAAVKEELESRLAASLSRGVEAS